MRFVVILCAAGVSAWLPVASSAAAQTAGPTQPEFQTMSGSKAAELVDPFSGDLRYTIPVFDLPGPNGSFPFVLTYQSGFGVAQEATWVGLGWALNPGLISRDVRGLPDDYNGDEVKTTRDARPNWTFGVGGAANLEIFGGDLQLSVGLRGYYNNYRGLGFTRDIGIAGSVNSMFGTSLTANPGLSVNLSLDSEEGASVTPSLSLTYSHGQKGEKHELGADLGMSINSRVGATGLQLGMSYTPPTLTRLVDRETGRRVSAATPFRSHHFWSFGQPARFPAIERETSGYGANLRFKFGGNIWGVFASGAVSIFGQRQVLKHRGTARPSPAYGYLYLHNGTGGSAVLDFNREKDGLVRKNTPNLAIPNATHDLYVASGQTLAGTLRPFRTDIGILTDPDAESTSWSVSLGGEFGGGMIAHLGIDGSVTYTEARASRWMGGNGAAPPGMGFASPDTSPPLDEQVYFAFVGESALEPSAAADALTGIGGERAVRDSLEREGALSSFTDVPPRYPTEYATTRLIDPNGDTTIVARPSADRRARGTAISWFTNQEIAAAANGLPELHVEYLDEQEQRQPYVRDVNSRGSHIGAFVLLGPDGMRHVYALPTYNLVHQELQFSVDRRDDFCGPTVPIPSNITSSSSAARVTGSDEYYDKKELPPYATAYLLTAILGPDYVDADLVPGPSDGDFGYWVKFIYQRTSQSYEWRAPFQDANFNEGYRNEGHLHDDKASFMWGTKELWYLRSAETTTHIAEFSTSDRRDAHGAAAQGGRSRKLDRIELYSKAERFLPDGRINQGAQPIKRVHFAYTYRLAQDVPNHNASVTDRFPEAITLGGVSYAANTPRPWDGKLTLERVWFTYESSSRGKVSPYDFQYDTAGGPLNPPFQDNGYDRWGAYRSYQNYCEIAEFPYVAQDAAGRARADTTAAAWHLRAIQLPSGGRIEVDYEADRYAHVQNRRAMHMVPIAAVSGAATPARIDSHASDAGAAGAPYRRIRFALAEPTTSASDAALQLAHYAQGVEQLYFKVCIWLTVPGSGRCEFVAGYAEVDSFDLELPAGNLYTRAWVQLRQTNGYHPFSVAAWQHLRLNQPELLRDAPFTIQTDNRVADEVLNVLSHLDAFGDASDLLQLFMGFNAAAHAGGWGTEIDLSRSWIRLHVPNRAKVGGGVRVRRVLLIDAWSESTLPAERSDTIGQVFYYDLEDGSSSGVAEYEPAIGGEENPLRTARVFAEDLLLASDYNLFFEYPINESHFPGPSVGYSRVTVRTFATDRVRAQLLREGTPTAGETVHAFYTAQDFPVRTEAARISKRTFKLWLPLPLIGQLTIDNLGASQGYAILLNDMHGKPRSVEVYEVNPDGSVRPGPISSTEYRYQAIASVVGDGAVEYDLDNTVSVVDRVVSVVNGQDTPHLESTRRVLGRQVDFFADMRRHKVQTYQIGANYNADVSPAGFIPIPFLSVWPAIGVAVNETRTVVTNKVVFKSGILIETITRREGAVTRAAHLAFEGVTGRPVLTSVTNAFEDSVFSLSSPARWFFGHMGPAYRTAGARLSATVQPTGQGRRLQVDPSSEVEQYLTWAATGDELAVRVGNAASRARVVSIDVGANTFVIEPEEALTQGNAELVLVRPGLRNLLNASGSELRSLTNPFRNKRYESCEAVYTYPCEDDQTGDPARKRVSARAAKLLSAYDDVQRAAAPRRLSALSDFERVLGECWEPGLTTGDGVLQDLGGVATGTAMRFRLNDNRIIEGRLRGQRRGVLQVEVQPARGTRERQRVATIALADVQTAWVADRRARGGWSSVTTTVGTVEIPTVPGVTDCPKSCGWSLLDSTGRRIRNDALDSFSDAYPVDVPANGLWTDPETGYGYTGLAAVAEVDTVSIVVFIYSDCEGWVEEDPDPGMKVCVDRRIDVFEVVDSVLDASGIRFSGAWPQSFDDVRFEGTAEDVAEQRAALADAGGYANGQDGLWRPQRFYTYVDDRQQSPAVNVRRDGTFNGVTLFDGGSERLFECAPKWRLTKEVTRYNPYAFVTEHQNILEIPTGALYGYRGALNTAYAANARYDEIGFEGFEEYRAGEDVGEWNRAASNIDVHTRADVDYVTVATPGFEIEFGFAESVVFDPRFATISSIFPPLTGFPHVSIDSVEIFPEARVGPRGGMDVRMPAAGKYGVRSLGLMPDGKPFIVLDGLPSFTPHPDPPIPDTGGGRPGIQPGHNPLDEIWRGKIKVFRECIGCGVVVVPRRTPIVEVVATKAHTGRHSLMVSEPDSFPQPRLNLMPGRRYVLAAWVSRDTTDTPTFRSGDSDAGSMGLEVQFLNGQGHVFARHPLAQPDGPVIEGWQQIETTFTMPDSAARISIRFQNGTDTAGNQLRAYFDDIRVFPATANMESYVYDPANYRLVAMLDNNNFARLFAYDEEGALHLVRQETVRGILTLRESRLHLRERPE